jgi:hypothetical protein
VRWAASAPGAIASMNARWAAVPGLAADDGVLAWCRW